MTQLNKVKLSNAYHNTSTYILSIHKTASEAWDQLLMDVYDEDQTSNLRSARRIKARVKRALCGLSNCSCGIVR